MIPQPILLMPNWSISTSSVIIHQIMVITKNIRDEKSIIRFVYRKYMPLNNQDTSQIEYPHDNSPSTSEATRKEFV